MRIYTGGTFDVPHLGHLNFFNKIKEMFPMNPIHVALNTDEFIKEFKGSAPLFTYAERYRFLDMIGGLLISKNFGGADSKPAILSVNPDIIIVGSDWLKKDYCKQMGFTPEWLEDHNISLMYIPYTKGISTTIIKERLNAR